MRPNFTEKEYAAILKKHGRVRGKVTGLAAGGVPSVVGKPAPSPYFPYKSKTEYLFARELNLRKFAHEIDDWSYEPVNFRLPGRKNFYKIDWCSWKGIAVTFIETKGFNPSDDRSLVKMKTAAGLNPWARFILVKLVKGQWEEKVIQ